MSFLPRPFPACIRFRPPGFAVRLPHRSQAFTMSHSTSSPPPSTSKAVPRDPNYRVLTSTSMNQAVLTAEYAVRGPLSIRADQLRDQLESGGQGMQFNKVINCNIGNPQQLGQKPLTYLRQVRSITDTIVLFRTTMGGRGREGTRGAISR